MTRNALTAFLAITLLTGACATVKTSDEVEAGAASGGSFSSVITRDELSAQALLGSNAYDAIQRLRPGYLMDRRTGNRVSQQPIQLSVNGGVLTPVNSLSRIPVSVISEIRYLNTGEASQKFGSRANGPVILITLQPQGPG